MKITTQIVTNDGPTSAGDQPRVTGYISSLDITNKTGQSIQYSNNSGASFTTLAASGTASLGMGDPSMFRFRRDNSGAYPLAIDAEIVIGEPPYGGIVPDTNDSAGIIAAIAAAVEQKVWGVRLHSVDYTIDQDITLVNNVALIGVPPHLTYSGDLPDDSLVATGGTRFIVSAGVTALKFNNVDNTVEPVDLAPTAITGIGLYGITFIGGKSHIDVGAYLAMGPVYSRFKELYSFESTDFGFNFENFQHCTFENLYQVSRNVPGGGIRFACTLSASLLPGNSTISGEIYTYTPLRNARSIVFEASGPVGCQMNQLHVSGRLQANRYGGGVVAIAVTTTSGSGNIGVADATNYSYLQIGVPVIFDTTAPGGFTAGTVYFVSGRPAASTITLTTLPASAVAIAATTTGSYTASSNGFAGLEIIANVNSTITNCDFGNVDIEAASTVSAIVIRRTRQCKLYISEIMASSYGTAICGRDAALEISCGSMNGVSTDIDNELITLRNFGRAINTITAGITLTAGGHQGHKNYNSATAGTITVPAGLPYGYEAGFTQVSTGALTFAAESGVTITARGGLLNTTGAGETVYLRATGKNTYVLSGVKTGGYTVATLPAGTAGMEAYVTDATAPTFLGALTGGGTVVCPVFHNGVSWVSA